MSDGNKTTLSTYDEHLDEYIDKSPSKVGKDELKWREQFCATLAKGSSILEIGSGLGRDARELTSYGFSVTASDAAQSFVDYLDNLHLNVIKFNVIEDSVKEKFDAVYANAVLLHFNPEQLRRALENIQNLLKPTGVLAVRVKRGSGSEWIDSKLNAPVFYQYWNEQDFNQYLSDAGFKVIWSNNGVSRNSEWLQIIAQLQNSS